MRKFIRSIAVCFVPVLALIPFSSYAQSLHYNYVDAGLSIYPSAGSQTWVGPKARLSMSLTDEFFAFGELSYLTDDVDFTHLIGGAGYRHELDPGTDVWGGLGLVYSNYSFGEQCTTFNGQTFCVGGDSANDMALGLFGGVRHIHSEELELAGTVRMVTGDFDYVGLTGTARYQLDGGWTLVADLDLMDGDFGLFGGVHFRF